MKKQVKNVVAAVALAIPVLCQAQQSAEAYPTKPVYLIVPYGAGGSTDTFARQLATHLGKQLGQPVVVDNKPGAGTSLGAGYVARSAADGYTVLLGDTATFAYNKFLYPQLQYDPQESFEPISLISKGSMVLAGSAEKKVNSLGQLIDDLKKDPSKYNYASAGVGSPPHIFMESLLQSAGVSGVKHIPYRGELPGLTDMIAGSIDFMFIGPRSAVTQASSGRVNLLGSSMKSRIDNIPGLPSISEVVPGYEQIVWQALVVPKGTPKPVLEKLNTAVNDALSSPEFREWQNAQGLGVEYNGSSPEALAEMMKQESVRASEVIKAAGITMN